MPLLFQLFVSIVALADAPTYPYWHVYVDDQGLTRQTRCTFAGLQLKGGQRRCRTAVAGAPGRRR